MLDQIENRGDQSPAGGIEKSQQFKSNGLLESQKAPMFTPIDQDCLGKESLMTFEATAVTAVHQSSKPSGDEVTVEQTLGKEIVISGTSVVKSVKQLKVNLPSQSDLEEIGVELDSWGRFSAVTIPRYVNLEPSLAMDWLEISWDELHIKERVGAGTSLCSSLYDITPTCFHFSLSILIVLTLFA